jgi:hypothetical protein
MNLDRIGEAIFKFMYPAKSTFVEQPTPVTDAIIEIYYNE